MSKASYLQWAKQVVYPKHVNGLKLWVERVKRHGPSQEKVVKEAQNTTAFQKKMKGGTTKKKTSS